MKPAVVILRAARQQPWVTLDPGPDAMGDVGCELHDCLSVHGEVVGRISRKLSRARGKFGFEGKIFEGKLNHGSPFPVTNRVGF